MSQRRGMWISLSVAVVAVVVAVIAVVVAVQRTDDQPAARGFEVIEDPLAYFGERTTLNGEAPPALPEPLVDVSVMLDTINADGDRLLVTQGTREAGTRVGIHVHQWGGQTCVISGTITDFVEGQEPMVWPAGTCYYMPPNTPMTAANLGDDDAVLIDTFVIPVDGEPIIILEPGYPGGPE